MRPTYRIKNAKKLMDVYAGYYGDYTPLMCAAKVGDLKILNILLKRGAKYSINQISSCQYRESALSVAVIRGNDGTREEVVKILLDHGADMEFKCRYRNSRGCTPLIIATKRNEIGTMKVLLQNGADVSMRNEDGHTAWDCAKNTGIFNENRGRKLLREYGA